MVAEVRRRGHKITPERIVRIARLLDDRIVWLEEGNEGSGLLHLMDPSRVQQFEKAGVNKSEIVDTIFRALTETKPIGIGSGDRLVYDVQHGNGTVRIALSVADNGYIVGANPRSKSRKVKPVHDATD
ncbi:hypothetical protein B1813_12890 [Saccharomonospora piscinae]|uniref:Uncharacterized protein n=1 Tax=Saccharomonospora piscinae TaxID=687388 RepID=A0A1V9A837_SACPI|nr:hypothetical protein B1813_12890 [Saccharomonospora piscinae]